MSAATAGGPADPLETVDTRSASAVATLFEDAADACRSAQIRSGSVERVPRTGTLLATGDLHDNPLHFARVLTLAHLDASTDASPRRVTLHEVIHGSHDAMGLDHSWRALGRVAALKRAHPEIVHPLLANHELSQIVGLGVMKDGLSQKQAFIDGVEITFPDDAPRVLGAIETFIRAMPLALVVDGNDGERVLCAHSLPDPALFDRFDPAVLERDLTDEDYTPRRGSAHLMVWGRRHTPELLETLAQRWGVGAFVLGHEHTEEGVRLLPPNAVILNSDHERGAALEIDLANPPIPPDPANIEPLVRRLKE